MVKKKVDIKLINALNKHIVEKWDNQNDFLINRSTHNTNISISQKGIPKTPEHVENQRLSLTGYKHTSETKQRISKVKTGVSYPDRKPLSEEALQNVKNANKAKVGKKLKPHSEETKKKISEKHLGKKLSTEHIEKLTVSHLGYKVKEETKKKISNTSKGKKKSAETIQKMSETKRERIANDPEFKARLVILAKKASEAARIKKLSSKGETK